MPRKPKSWMNWGIENTPVGQNKMWQEVNKMVMKNTNGVYPAPFAIIDCVKEGLKSNGTSYKFEREKVSGSVWNPVNTKISNSSLSSLNSPPPTSPLPSSASSTA